MGIFIVNDSQTSFGFEHGGGNCLGSGDGYGYMLVDGGSYGGYAYGDGYLDGSGYGYGWGYGFNDGEGYGGGDGFAENYIKYLIRSHEEYP